MSTSEEEEGSGSEESEENDRHGIWIRRRRLDGGLNRVPLGFYSKVWMIVENCRGVQIRGQTLDTFLTQGVSFSLTVWKIQNFPTTHILREINF